jgi:hypothetical protein
VDIKSIWMHDRTVLALTGLGGGGCAAPGPQQGCFRMAIAQSAVPLGDHIFNRSPHLIKERLPTNPQGYTTPIRNPEGGPENRYSLLGVFFRPADNGFSENRPVPQDWGQLSGNSVLVTFPFDDKSLWP